MGFLTKQEELFLLTIHRLKGLAYLVNIREHLLEYTRKDWAFGSIYITLSKLVTKGLVTIHIGEPSSVRGGKAIKYYRMTEDGIAALVEAKELQDVMWGDFLAPAMMEKVKNEK